MRTAARIVVAILAIYGFGAPVLNAGVRKEIERSYTDKYENRAMFLKIPVRGARQTVFVQNSGVALDRSNITLPLAFKVGEQVRITGLDFKDNAVVFKVASTDLSREAEVVFQFSAPLEQEFPQQAAFEKALKDSFTEGLSYTDIDTAKEQFIKDQYDDLIQQFATATNSTPEFVIKTISEKNPEYKAAKTAARDATAKLQETEKSLSDEREARKDAQSELRDAKKELSGLRSSADTLREDKAALTKQVRDLTQQEAQSEARNKEYERRIKEYDTQVNGLLGALDVDTAGTANIGERMQAVGKSFDSLRSERSGLTQKLSQLNKQLESLQNNNRTLTVDLKKSEGEKAKLAGEIRVMTSDKKSLQSRYMTTKKRKEELESADALTRSLRFQRRIEEREEGAFLVNDVYLLSKRIGVLEVRIPKHPGEVYPAKFSLDSPDTVQFTDEERKLYSALGEKLQVEAAWRTETAKLKPVLASGKATQEVAPRGSAQWAWRFEGEINKPQRVYLHTVVRDAAGEPISLPLQEFSLEPGGVGYYLLKSFSPISLGAGLIVGLALFGLFSAARSGKQRAAAKRNRPRDESFVQKKLYD